MLIENFNYRKMKSYKVSANCLKANNFNKFLKKLEEMNELRAINFYKCNVKHRHLKKLTTYFVLANNLVTIDLSANNLTSENIPILTTILRLNKNIKNLLLVKNKFTYQDVVDLLETCQVKNEKTIVLFDNCIDTDAIINLKNLDIYKQSKLKIII